VNARAGVPLELVAASFSRGPRPILTNLSLRVDAGEWTAIVGANGAGKSTLLGLLAGLIRPGQGEVRLGGRPIEQWSARERSRRIVWLGQTSTVEGELSARDVVRLGRLPSHGVLGAPTIEDEAAVEAALAETESIAYADRRVTALSGGERQRVLLARAFAAAAQAYLLDEPTAHLDVQHQRQLVQSLRRRAHAGAAVVSALHDLTIALAADRLVVLAAGAIAGDGPPHDPAVQAALCKTFADAIDIRRIGDPVTGTWVAVPRIEPAPTEPVPPSPIRRHG